MGATEILVSGGVAAILAAVAGGGLKAFGVEMPLLASMKRQILVLAVGVGLIALGLFSARPPSTSGGDAAAQAPAQGNSAAAIQAPPAAAPIVQQGAAGTRIPPISGLQFIAARDVLIRSGWAPIGQGNPYRNDNILSGNGPMFLERGYSEMVSCAGTGAAECLFAYRSDSGQVLHVRTHGEGETASIFDAQVVDCSADPTPWGC